MKQANSTERDILLSIYSDTFKDVNGFRPRGILFPSNLTTPEIEAKLAGLHAELDTQLEAERAEWADEESFYTTVYGDE